MVIFRTMKQIENIWNVEIKKICQFKDKGSQRSLLSLAHHIIEGEIPVLMRPEIDLKI